jgi:carboxynorspermidine decarboxylase
MMDAIAARLVHDTVRTPAFICDYLTLLDNARQWRTLCRQAKCTLLFSVKSLSQADAISRLHEHVDGFSVSSLFEAFLVADSTACPAFMHFVSPLVHPSDFDSITELCNRVTLNSFEQIVAMSKYSAPRDGIGIRINPCKSLAKNDRYDPCRRNSKLGVRIDRLAAEVRRSPELFADVQGLHVHSNCDASDAAEWIATIRTIEACLGDDMRRFRWLNVGGGYAFAPVNVWLAVQDEAARISQKYELEVVFEPGAAISRQAGYFVSTVGDIIEGDDHAVAVLDLTINHWPEIFDYPFKPDVVGHLDGGRYTYLLAGCSCLAGDMFGEYSFSQPLEVGSRLIFPNAGAYSIVKAHMFNGINLPSIYALKESGEVVLIKKFTYDDFARKCGINISGTLGT